MNTFDEEDVAIHRQADREIAVYDGRVFTTAHSITKEEAELIYNKVIKKGKGNGKRKQSDTEGNLFNRG